VVAAAEANFLGFDESPDGVTRG